MVALRHFSHQIGIVAVVDRHDDRALLDRIVCDQTDRNLVTDREKAVEIQDLHVSIEGGGNQVSELFYGSKETGFVEKEVVRIV